MAEITIKGMEMPERCCECQFIKCGVGDWKGEFWCSAIRFEPLTNIDTRPDWCPLRPAPGWISVEERLPEEKHAVLVWKPQYLNSYVAVLSDGEWFVFGGFGTKVFGVTHWMPLPEPPWGGDGK